MGIKRPACESDHSLVSRSEVCNAWDFTSTLSVRLQDVVRRRRETPVKWYKTYIRNIQRTFCPTDGRV
jgi:hypothetical protein